MIAGANVYDTKLLEKTLEAAIVERSNPKELEQHLCLDKGYDNLTSRAAVEKHQYTPHIRKISDEKWDENQQKVYPPERWVVERTLGWLSSGKEIPRNSSVLAISASVAPGFKFLNISGALFANQFSMRVQIACINYLFHCLKCNLKDYPPIWDMVRV